MREKINIDSGWLFYLGDIDPGRPKRKGPFYMSAKSENALWGPAARYYNDSSDAFAEKSYHTTDLWQRIDLPHDYLVDSELSESENNAAGYIKPVPAWYRKYFALSPEDEGKRIVLYFEGVMGQSAVYINGHLMKRSFTGYTSFETDITDIVDFDGTNNVIALKTDPSENEGWWYEGGGIYRHVWLEKTPLAAIERNGIRVLANKKEENIWQVDISAEFVSIADIDTNLSPVFSIVKDGKVFAEGKSSVAVPAYGKAECEVSLKIENPEIWDIDNPAVYEVKVLTGEDELSTNFGFRTYSFTKDGFFLNGRKVKVNGVCCHEGLGMSGRYVPDSVQRYQISLMKSMGANGYRTSHYMHSEVIMDELDRQGFIVMDEARRFNSDEESLSQLRALVKRDRNHPSVFIWSIANEEAIQKTDYGKRITKRLTAAVKALDNTRPVTSAVDTDVLNSHGVSLADVIGINYNLANWDAVREKYPEKPFAISECCAAANGRGWYEKDSLRLGRTSSYDHDISHWFSGREKTWKAIYERDYIIGGFQWTGYEYRGETVWPRICSVSGSVDLYMLKKDAYYQNRALWCKEPVVHILPHWNHPLRLGEKIPVWVYSNCESVELFKDGVSLGKKPCGRFSHAEWQVEYAPGRLEAVAIRGGVEYKDFVETSGEAKALKLTQVSPMTRAGVRDGIIFECYCVDDQGREVPDASPVVTFRSNDESVAFVAGTGSDITDHEKPSSPTRRMWAGRIAVLVETTKKEGEFSLYAEAPGLTPAVLKCRKDAPAE